MRKYGVPTNKRDVFLDNELDEEKIKIQLLKLADASEEKGIAIGIGHVKPQTHVWHRAVAKYVLPNINQNGRHAI